MKIVPILAVTNALALGLAIFVYVKQDQDQGPRRAETSRVDPNEIAQLRMEIDELRRAQPGTRTYVPNDAEPGSPVPAPVASAGSDVPFASGAPDAGAPAGGEAAQDEFDPQEMTTFRRKVRKANELNQEEDQANTIIERVDQLVKENKIAPLTPAQKENVAKIVLASRRKGIEAWRKLREMGSLENANREDRGRLMRTEMETIRTETQRALEAFMPAADVKTYLDETTRDMGRLGGFGGGGPFQAPGR